jgi:O-antigen ligase
MAVDWRFPAELDVDAVRNHARMEAFQRRIMLCLALGFTLLLAAMAWRSAPAWTPVALAVFVVTLLTAFVRPTLGVYLIVALTLIGDAVIWPWWPFTKNMSSRESILFLNDAIIVNPLELVMLTALFAFFLRRLVDPTWTFRRGTLFTPIMVFSGFVLLGFLRGQASGGDRRVAIFEMRALLYVALVYVLVTNLFHSRQQYQRLLLVVMGALAVQSVFALQYYRDLPPEQKEVLERLGEHSSSLHMATLVVFLFALWLLRGPSRTRWLIFAMTPPVFTAFLLSQRRAAMVAMFVGIAVVTYFTYFRRRRAFWFFAPTALVLGAGFVAATWNASGALGLAAQAVKSVIAEDQLSEADRSSSLYREIEALNIYQTIRDNPLLGVGFGRTFSVYYPMPDISFYEFWAYRPHNSVLWIWLKMGIVGFAVTIFMIGRTIQRGARSVMLVLTRKDAVYVATAVAYVVMTIVYSYVDIGWDGRTMVLFAVAMAFCADYVDAVDEVDRRPLDRTLYPEMAW